MAINARDKAVQYFDWNIVAGKTAGLFESL
jgi:hypothetical protein